MNSTVLTYKYPLPRCICFTKSHALLTSQYGAFWSISQSKFI